MTIIKNKSMNFKDSKLSEIGNFHHTSKSSVDLHFHDADEYWYFTKGKARIISDLVVSVVEKGDLVYTPVGNEHGLIEVIEEVEGIFFSGIPVGQKRKGHLFNKYDIKNILIFGKSGSGKKNFIQNYLLGIKDKCQVVILDSKNEFEIGKKINLSQKVVHQGINNVHDCQNQVNLLKNMLDFERAECPLIFVIYDFDRELFDFVSNNNNPGINFILSTEDKELFEKSSPFYKIHIRNIAIMIFYTDSEKFLLQERGKHSKFGEEWSFFGGSLESEESPEKCIIREIKEELCYDIKDYIYIRQIYKLIKDNLFFNVYIFACKIKDNVKFNLNEGDSYKFFKKEELSKLKLGPMDKIIVEIFERWDKK